MKVGVVVLVFASICLLGGAEGACNQDGNLDKNELCDGKQFQQGIACPNGRTTGMICKNCVPDFSRCPNNGGGCKEDNNRTQTELCDGKDFRPGITCPDKSTAGLYCVQCMPKFDKCPAPAAPVAPAASTGSGSSGAPIAPVAPVAPPAPVSTVIPVAPVAPIANNGGGSVCGNGKVEPNEACEQGVAVAETCQSHRVYKFKAGPVGCTNCQLDWTKCEMQAKPATCGDGVAQPGEFCDEKDGKVAFSPTFSSCGAATNNAKTGGSLKCKPDCSLDTSGCKDATDPCGNGAIDSGEVCDGMNFNPMDKSKLCPSGGTLGLVCKPDCKDTDKSGCKEEKCSVDGTLSATEACDGDKFIKGLACPGETDPKGLKCTDKCQPDFSGCPALCGNGKLNAGEDCDTGTGAPAITMMCQSNTQYAFKDGKVGCTNCKYDWTKCELKQIPATCANGKVDPGELCDNDSTDKDKHVLKDNWKTCDAATNGLKKDGELKCKDCALDTSDCKVQPKCGNGVIDAGEKCDKGVEWSMECKDLDSGDYKEGTAKCGDDCQIDLGECKKEGDGEEDSKEEEGSNMMMIGGIGLAVAAAVGVGVFLMMRKKKKAAAAAEEEEWEEDEEDPGEEGAEGETEMEVGEEGETTNYDDFGYDETGE